MIDEFIANVCLLNNNLVSLSSILHTFTFVNDNTDFNSILNDGWYNIFSDVNGPGTVKNRWLLHVERVTNSSIGITVQTAFFYAGGVYETPKQRHIYYVNSSATFMWSDWY